MSQATEPQDAAPEARLSGRPTAPVLLMYHSIAERPTADPGTVTRSAFSDQLDWLTRSGFEIVSLEQVVDELARGGRAAAAPRVVITFDDGYRDLLDNGVPVLKEHEAPATVFLVGGMAGKTAEWSRHSRDVPLLTLDEVRAVQAEGVALGSHGYMHVDLTTVTAAELDEELIRSREFLTDLGVRFLPFSYPWGYRTRREVAAVRRHGYACAVDIGQGVDVRRPDLYRLSRVEVRGDMAVADFARVVTAATTIPPVSRWVRQQLRGMVRRLRGG